MKHTRSIGKLTIVLGIGVAMLTGNLAPNISIAVDAFTPNQSDEQIVKAMVVPPSEVYIEDLEYLKKLGTILRTTTSGNEALSFAVDREIGVVFQDDNGAMFKPAQGYIILDRTVSPVAASLSFVREMAHALNDVQENTGDAFLSTRDEYIADILLDEVVATVKTICAETELEDTIVDVSCIAATLEDPYWAAYVEAVRDA